MGLFNRKDKNETPGDKVDQAMDKAAEKKPEFPTPKIEKLETPDGVEVHMVNMSGEDMPPEIRDAIGGLLNALTGNGTPEGMPEGLRKALEKVAGGSADEPCTSGCAKGHPRCKDTDVESLVEWVKGFQVRVHKDPEDPELVYFAGDDVELAMVAAFRLAILGMQATGMPNYKQEFAAQVFHNVMENAGVILGDEERNLELSKVEVPDSIPDDWKTDE